MSRTALRIAIRGVVQGVGFRPFVYRMAERHRVRGWVLNGAAGVEIHAEAVEADLAAFVAELRDSPPVAARVTQFDGEPAEAEGFQDFQIRDSRSDAQPTVRVSADLTICADCLCEMNDPRDRRYEYPYINCTNCGPRYSIVRALPYDRPRTTIAAWPLCEQCRREYENPVDRRYHAQPTACAACGPNYRLEFPNTAEPRDVSPSPIQRTAELLRNGKIVAIKGIGGYHLACDVANARAVEALRERKFRKEKPLAVMVRDLDEARSIAALSAEHERLLADLARPIVLASAKRDLPGIAPDTDAIGIMLPYSPLHHLLFKFDAPSPLVLTSANRSSEPIAYLDNDARERLAGIADALLIGERPIARRVDDSVATVRRGRPFMVRRSRGYAPAIVYRLPTDEPILALGADLKNSIALVIRGEILVSQHIGDLGDFQAESALQETIHDLLEMYEIRPEQLTVVHDLHPEFTSTRIARALPARRHIAVQHHHAHIASVLAEHGLLEEPAVGVALDGTGYGTDGSIWGGEFFVGSVRNGFERCATLRPVMMPGGDAAARFPVQAAAGFLAELSDLPDMSAAPWHFPRRFTDALAMIAKNIRCFRSTSAGRLFDTIAALCGFTREVTFEGQAAIWLEHQARRARSQGDYPFPDFDHRRLLLAILADRIDGRGVPEIAAAFHASFAKAIVRRIRQLCAEHQTMTIALSGGVFQNEVLLDLVYQDLETDKLVRVLTNEAVPVNDGGVCLGQAALAGVCR